MAITAAKLQVEVDAETRGFNRGMDQTNTRVRTFGDRMKSGMVTLAKWGAMAAAAGTAAAGAFAFKAVSAASDLNETLSKTQTVFGDATESVTGFADRMADAFGLPKAEMLDAASNIGLVAKASGLAEGAAAEMSVEMSQLAADAASFYNVPLPEALEKIRSGLVGEAEPLRSFGVLLSAAAVQEEAVAMGIAQVGEELTEQQKVMARSSLITKGMTDASGDLEKTQGSMANRVRELKGRFANWTAEMGQRLLPVAEKVLAWASDSVPAAFDAVERFVDRAAAAFGRLRVTVGRWWQSVRPQVEAFVAAIRQNWPTLRQAFQALGQTVRNIAQIFGKTMGSMKGSAKGDMSSIVESITLLSKALLAVAVTVEKVTGWIADNWRWLRPILTADFRTISSTATDMGRRIGEAVREGIQKAIDWLRQLPSRARSAVGNLGSMLYQAGRDLLTGFISGIKSKVSDAVASVRNAVSSTVSGAKRALGIRSPSKVFAEMAEQSMAGWVEGMRQQRDRSAMATLQSMGIPEVQQTVSQTVVAQGASRSPQAGGTIVIPISVGSHVLDEIVVEGQIARSRRGQVSAVVR